MKILGYDLIGNFKKVLRIEYYGIKGKCKIAAEEALNNNNEYIGTLKFAKYLSKHCHINSYEKLLPEPDVCSIGFSEKEQKWYGWSHRAIYGFGIGSKVSKGDCAYVPSNLEEFLEDTKLWYSDDEYSNVVAKVLNEHVIEIRYDIKTIKNGLLHRMSQRRIPTVFGHGEWTAKTLDDAKQMAIDFVNGY